jgi:uncharacterized repeat protein (TIGR04138 family)
MEEERARLYAAAAADKRYAIEAYEFLCHALAYTQQTLDRVPEPGTRPEDALDKHVSGKELCEGIRQFALKQFGPLAHVVFKNWRVHGTLDFGKMVYHLIDAGVWHKSPTDRLEDFDEQFDFEQALVKDANVLAEDEP